jgi:hypothetical protein
MHERLLAGSLLVLVLSGCGGSWTWRDRSYPLPEQALMAQERDLTRDVAAVTPLLNEDRLPGRGVALLASNKTLLRRDRSGDVEQALFSAGLKANEAAAGAKAAGKAGLFAGGIEVVTVDQPDQVLVSADVTWTLLYLPRSQDGAQTWWIINQDLARGAEVPLVPANGDDRFDRFVDGLQGAARGVLQGGGFLWPEFTQVDGWTCTALLPGRIDGRSSSCAGLQYDVFGDRPQAADVQAQIGAAIAVLTNLGGKPGPRVELPAKAPATHRCRVLFTFSDRSLVAEIQAAPGRIGMVYVQGPAKGLRTTAATSNGDLADDHLAPTVRRAFGSLTLKP